MTGADLKAAIKSLGWTQRQFSAWVGMSETHVSKLISGRKPITPHLAILVRLCLVLHADGRDPMAGIMRVVEENR